MNSPDTTAQRSAADLDATDELPALDPAAYEAQVLAGDAAQAPASGPRGTGEVPPAAAVDEDDGDDAMPPVPDADVMLEVERWIVQKSEELRAQQAALSLAQRERTAGMARADALSRELGETSANLEALNRRLQILEDELTGERQVGQRRAAELVEAQREAARRAEELTAARAAEERQAAAAAALQALLEQRSGALETLNRTHDALGAERERAAAQLAELESRLVDSENRERNAQGSIEAQSRAHAELTQRLQDETRTREGLTAERELLQAQLASCIERLHSRESYRTIYQSSIGELDAELASTRLRATEQEIRANRLAAELEQVERQLQGAVRERDEARQANDRAVSLQVSERGESERACSALESRLAGLTSEYADARARLLAVEATLADTQRRAEAQVLAGATAAERLRMTELEIASRQAELAGARLESERDRASLSELSAALARSQTLLAEQTRLLEARESEARTMTASHAEHTALINSLRGEIEELSARVTPSEAERQALEARVAALMKELVDSGSRLARGELMNVQLRATVKQLHQSLAERDAELQRAARIASTHAYALGRVQSSFDELGRGSTASEAGLAHTQTSILTRIDGGQNHSFVLRGRTTIGRDPDNDLPLPINSVSRYHAVLIPAFRSALLQDLGSTNGVLVNRRRVRCARLEHGDVITLGEAKLRYTVTPLPTSAASPGPTPPRRRPQPH
ncbi:MAG TPA: FHA domain-containing protein [Steroidobacteraceae bacterium]|nr:FHA domain-containing protein [Steroidobacteraceae bacterium]